MPQRPNTRRMHLLRDQFYAQGQRLDAKGDPEANCWICKKPIDYVAQPNTTDQSHNLDHYHAYANRPDLAEDPSNFRHAHRVCNQSRGKEAPSPGLGDPLPNWW
jgi:5-methylcytosine-specific restriction endonuclease McrA